MVNRRPFFLALLIGGLGMAACDHAPDGKQAAADSDKGLASRIDSPPLVVGPDDPSTCQFVVPTALVCSTASAAGYAFQTYGYDTQAVEPDYRRATLHRMGCGFYGDRGADAKIAVIATGRLPTNDGWVPVWQISVNDRDIWNIASAYLTGRCPRFQPLVERSWRETHRAERAQTAHDSDAVSGP